MKKSTIWTIACVMGISLLTLLYLQFRYFENVYDMRKEQFEEAVSRSLNQTAQDLEFYEAQARLDSELTEKQNSLPVDEDSLKRAYRWQMAQAGLYVEDSTDSKNDLNGAYVVEDTIEHFFRQKELMEEMLSILYKPYNKELTQRLDFKELDSTLKRELSKNGVNLAYHSELQLLTDVKFSVVRIMWQRVKMRPIDKSCSPMRLVHRWECYMYIFLMYVNTYSIVYVL